LSELAEKGQLAKSVPEVARILLGERLMQLEKEGLVSPGTRAGSKE
jgi:DNA-binding HxlR family transcriptional regulator